MSYKIKTLQQEFKCNNSTLKTGYSGRGNNIIRKRVPCINNTVTEKMTVSIWINVTFGTVNNAKKRAECMAWQNDHDNIIDIIMMQMRAVSHAMDKRIQCTTRAVLLTRSIDTCYNSVTVHDEWHTVHVTWSTPVYRFRLIADHRKRTRKTKLISIAPSIVISLMPGPHHSKA